MFLCKFTPMERKTTTTKIDEDVHQKVKIFCARVKLNLLDFYTKAATEALYEGQSRLEKIAYIERKKKKAK